MEQKSNVLFIFERTMPTVETTKKSFLRLLVDHCNIVFKQLSNVCPEDIDRSDVIIFIRPDNLISAGMAKRARESGATVVTFCDDDILHIDSTVLPLIPWRKKGLEKTLGESHVIMSSSIYILDQYVSLTFGKRIAIFDTPVFEEDFSMGENKGETIKMVYAASPSHVTLFDKYVKSAFLRIAEEYGKRISMTFIGLRPELGKINSGINIVFKKSMPLDEYRAYMEEEHFDMGLAPLNNDNFSKCKYFNKYIEYTISGVMGLFSNTEPYTYVVKNGENGLLVDDDKWYEAIKEAIDSAELRKTCLENARSNLKEEFCKEKILKKLIDYIPELLCSDKKRESCQSFIGLRVEYFILRTMDYVYLIIYYLRQGGFNKLKEKIVIHFRENGTAK